MSESYIGQKGYTIYKKNYKYNILNNIRKDLTITPKSLNNFTKTKSFTIFLENTNKIYLPRYYGIKQFNDVKLYKFNNIQNIDLSFNGTLRDYQVPIVDKYLNSIDKYKGGGGLLDIPCGFGKTVMALYILSILNVKTLIIVHKGFLLDQWIEQIKKLLPNATIGKIQGKILDYQNKDIVIGMLQSLSMKEYPAEIFSEFGLTIVDECHHISSEVFSKSLNKIVTKYTLGLSATINRKDGLTYVFKLFLGDVICSKKRDKQDNVLVKPKHFKSNDTQFNEVIYDFRGNILYSSMISKLCLYKPRTLYIVDIIKQELNLYNNQQIMVLAHNRNILNDIYNIINDNLIATIGFYIGGMKKNDLKQSENKQIIVATYAMAAEGLDIKTLTTLVLATPKTDITQAVGRILRIKRERPLIVDIVDSNEIFQKQWKKRLKFYKKSNYKILTNSENNENSENKENKENNENKENKENKENNRENKCLIDL